MDRNIAYFCFRRKKIYFYRWGHEVQNFKSKVRSGPEGSRGSRFAKMKTFAIKVFRNMSPDTSRPISMLDFEFNLLIMSVLDVKGVSKIHNFEKSISIRKLKGRRFSVSKCNFYRVEVIFDLIFNSKFMKMKMNTRTNSVKPKFRGSKIVKKAVFRNF